MAPPSTFYRVPEKSTTSIQTGKKLRISKKQKTYQSEQQNSQEISCRLSKDTKELIQTVSTLDLRIYCETE